MVIAQVLRARGYATGMVGKWHLGWDREDMPIHYGFDFYYGIPAGEDESDFVRGDAPTSDGVSPDQLARRYTEEAVKFITASRERRFFTYLAHRDPHLPNYPAPEFAGRSAAGAYGDVIEQLDATVGDLMKALRDAGARPRTRSSSSRATTARPSPPRGRARPARSAGARARARRAGCGCRGSCAGRRGSRRDGW